jgi:hypothetical protein
MQGAGTIQVNSQAYGTAAAALVVGWTMPRSNTTLSRP